MISHLSISEALEYEIDCLQSVSLDPTSFKLWFWETDQCLVVPKSYKMQNGFKEGAAALAAIGWPVAVRETGGGITPQGPGIANVSFIFSVDKSAGIDQTYDILCTPIEETLLTFGLVASRGALDGTFCDGKHNILIDGRKFAGAAQRQRRCVASPQKKSVLAHAMMLAEAPKLELFDAINLFLTHFGQRQSVQPQLHTGLLSELDLKLFLNILDMKFNKYMQDSCMKSTGKKSGYGRAA